ncbi:hypothetical protein LJC02_00780 [Breznakia sp. OttesenSCG-928-G09]|nr:hypothetical protein [Breznakia sp. OttesenSCG-928-G09]
MKTKNLQRIGLTKKQIDFVMAENGKDVNHVKEQMVLREKQMNEMRKENDHLYKELTKLNQIVERYNGIDVKELLETQKRYDKELLELKKSNAIERLFGDLPFASKLAKKQAIQEFEKQNFIFKDDVFIGVDSFFENLIKNDANAFYKR